MNENLAKAIKVFQAEDILTRMNLFEINNY